MKRRRPRTRKGNLGFDYRAALRTVRPDVAGQLSHVAKRDAQFLNPTTTTPSEHPLFHSPAIQPHDVTRKAHDSV